MVGDGRPFAIPSSWSCLSHPRIGRVCGVAPLHGLIPPGPFQTPRSTPVPWYPILASEQLNRCGTGSTAGRPNATSPTSPRTSGSGGRLRRPSGPPVLLGRRVRTCLGPRVRTCANQRRLLAGAARGGQPPLSLRGPRRSVGSFPRSLVPPLPGGLSAGGLDGVIGNPPLGAGEAGGAGMAELDTSRGGGAARRRRAVGHRCPRRECGREGSTASLCMFDRASGGGTARRVLAVARAVHPPVVRRPTTTCCSASSPLISWARPAWRGSW